MKRMRSFAVGAVACFASFIAISGNDRAISAEKISIGLSSTDALYGPWFYAQEKGYLAKHGFESTMTSTMHIAIEQIEDFLRKIRGLLSFHGSWTRHSPRARRASVTPGTWEISRWGSPQL